MKASSFENVDQNDRESKIMQLFYKIITILNQVHHAGFVHADLKPDNILFDSNGHVMIIDWGSCLKLDSINMRGTVCHFFKRPIMFSLGFSAPEQYVLRIGYASDIYALGKISNALLSGSNNGQFPRLERFVQLTKRFYATDRPTADEILRHELFESERQQYGALNSDGLPPFGSVINLTGVNEQYFHKFALPENDNDFPSTRCNGFLDGLRRCFGML